MEKFLTYSLAGLYLAFCLFLMAIGNPNAIPFFLYAGICLASENKRWGRYLAEEVAKIPFYKILLYETGAMIISASLAINSGLDVVPTLILTALSFLVLELNMEDELEDMSKYSYELNGPKNAFRAAIAVFPIVCLLPVMPTYVWSVLSLYQSGFTSLGFILNQISLVYAVCAFFIIHLIITYANEALPEQHFSWSTRHEEFHYPGPREG